MNECGVEVHRCGRGAHGTTAPSVCLEPFLEFEKRGGGHKPQPLARSKVVITVFSEWRAMSLG